MNADRAAVSGAPRWRTELTGAWLVALSAGSFWGALEELRILGRRFVVLASVDPETLDFLRPDVLLAAMLLYVVLFGGYLSLVAAGRLALAARPRRHATIPYLAWLVPFFVVMVWRLVKKAALSGNTYLTVVPPPTFLEAMALLLVCLVAVAVTQAVLGWLTRVPGLEPLVRPRLHVTVALLLLVGLGLPSLLPRRLMPARAADAGRQLEVTTRPGAPAAGFNVVVVVLDTTRRDRLGTYGYARPTSPRIDALAARGFRFDDARSVAPWTLPSHVSLFTGLYPSTHGTDGMGARVPADVATLAEVLRSAGYETAGFTNNPWIAPFTGANRGFSEFHPVWQETHAMRNTVHDLLPLRLWAAMRKRVPDDGGDLTLRRIRAWLERRDPGRPYFLFVNLMECHQPNYPSPGAERFLPDDLTEEDREALGRDTVLHESGKLLFTPRQLALLSDVYDGTVAYADQLVGELVDALDERGALENTLFVVTADHGENLGELGKLGHQFGVWDTLLDVPLVFVSFGAGLPLEGSSDLQVQLVDVPLTITELLGVRAPGFAHESRSMVPVLLDRESSPWRPAVAEYVVPPVALKQLRQVNDEIALATAGEHMRAWIDDGFKLVWRENGPTALYRVGDEANDVSDQYPERKREMEGALTRWVASREHARHVAAGAAGAGPSRATIELLRALGYETSGDEATPGSEDVSGTR